jgi:hypothetical protein
MPRKSPELRLQTEQPMELELIEAIENRELPTPVKNKGNLLLRNKTHFFK